MWRVLARSVIGTSHRRRDGECQDASFTHRMTIGDDEHLILACADGAGSAAEARLGATLACEAFCRHARTALSGGARLADLDDATVRAWYRSVRDELVDEAAERAIRVRELACTLLTAVVSAEGGVFAQVGDGAIVVGGDAGYEAIAWPANGEYANETTFVTGDHFEHGFAWARRDAPVAEVALFTDGLQRLALNFADQSVHAPFFAPMFEALRRVDHVDVLDDELARFLDSPAVNDRTDDDKTLVLAVWKGADGGLEDL